MGEVREPIKKNSIAKKNKIIADGFELICNKGYHNVSCVDIAKYCGVSTGIIYQYFKDKRDIFIKGVQLYSDKIMFPLIETVKNQKINKNTIEDIIREIIKKTIDQSTMTKKAHQELMSMSCLDNEVSKIFRDKEIEFANKFVIILKNNGFKSVNLNEKVHLIINLVDDLCHETVYHKHQNINYDILLDETVRLIIHILKEDEDYKKDNR